ncbi:hypothetical protein FOS14_04900 [Skermania sp. ID1734]|uniref:hypothetical protein n=1 Tax=Skermania sp. ID1734 TaxID=2597516 RepID=UPI0011809E85|nr:hypothetical protein [Skermania sp. ID1734]TSE01088.1 hypothetical protein FOS14_04900 [Skermania sp. ID1734]
MRLVRTLATGMLAMGAIAGISVVGAGSASALGITPLPGGVEVDLNHAETVWAHDNHVGIAMARLPHPSAESFGQTFESAVALSSQYPAGRVSFTAYGPLDDLSGTMVAFKE